MFSSDLLLTFFSFWALVHVIYRIILQPKTPNGAHYNLRASNHTSHLPLTNTIRTPPPTSKITLSYFCLHYKTTKFNALFDSLANRAPKFWRTWFNIGVLVGLLVMAVGVCVMTVAGWKLLIGMIRTIEFSTSNNQGNGNSKFVKRGEESHQVENNNEGHQVFVPVIPGVTLPISHLIYYLIALLICGIFHEAGHAIAAYCESVPLNFTGIFLYFFYPGAFVSFSDQHFNKCLPIKKLRILCAGVWHNIVLFLFGILILNSGLVILSMSLTGYRHTEGTGVSVISVEDNAELIDILYPSTLITKLNDYKLDEASLEKWNTFLLQNDKITKSDYGFCASEKDVTSSLDCCDINTAHPYGNSKSKEISCFQRSNQTDPHYLELSCLHVKPILVNMNEQRCRKDSDCENPSPMCVKPYTPAGFPIPVRIYFKYPPWIADRVDNKEQVLLWLGDLEDLWEMIQVSILQPRWSWVPLWVPSALELILRYTVSFSLALCVLNILPVVHLDGHQALAEILTWLFDFDETNSTAISISERNRQRKKIENGIVYGITGLVGWVVFGTLIFGIF